MQDDDLFEEDDVSPLDDSEDMSEKEVSEKKAELDQAKRDNQIGEFMELNPGMTLEDAEKMADEAEKIKEQGDNF